MELSNEELELCQRMSEFVRTCVRRNRDPELAERCATILRASYEKTIEARRQALIEYIAESDQKGTWVLSASVIEVGDVIYLPGASVESDQLAQEVIYPALVREKMRAGTFGFRFQIILDEGEFRTKRFDLADDIDTKVLPHDSRFDYDWRRSHFFGGRPRVRGVNNV